MTEFGCSRIHAFLILQSIIKTKKRITYLQLHCILFAVSLSYTLCEQSVRLQYMWQNRTSNIMCHLLTPRCTVLLELLTGLQLVKKFPAFHRTRRFITALKSVRHLSLSWASPIQAIYSHPTSCRSILISTHLRLGLLPYYYILQCLSQNLLTYSLHGAESFLSS